MKHSNIMQYEAFGYCYASSSTEDFDLELTDSAVAKNEDDCDATLFNECEIIDINIGSIVVEAYKVKKKLLKYLGVVQNIKHEYISVQFLKRSGEKTFSVRVGDLDDCSQENTKAVIKEGQSTMNSLGQHLIEENKIPKDLTNSLYQIFLKTGH